MSIKEINKKYGNYEGNILKKCHTKHINDFYVPQSEPCKVWWEWESKVGDLILENIRPNSNFLDAGANFGYFSLLAATLIDNGYIYSIEANPFVFSILQENIILHKLDNVLTYNYALSDGNNGELDFYWRNGANGNGRSYDPSKHDTNAWMIHKVKTVSLDFFSNKKIDLIKMDIEGAEFEVLQNSNIFFACNKQVKIILELHTQYILEQFGIKNYNNFMAYLDMNFIIEKKTGNFLVLTLQ